MIIKNRKSGAPKGGRVHWLLWHLSRDFKGSYHTYYDYKYHNYTFVRYTGRKLYDIFIVKQTSKHYWRCMYANIKKQQYECFGYENTRIIAEVMIEIYKNDCETSKNYPQCCGKTKKGCKTVENR